MPDEIHGAIHSVNRHKPLYESRGALEKSQLGSLQDDDDASRYSYVETPASTDTFDVGPLDVPGQSGGLPRKKLFGEHGWLGDVPGEAESPDKRKSKMIKDFGKKIKQHVGDIVSFFRSIRSRSCGFNRSSQAVDMVRAPPNPFTHGLSGQKIMAKSPIPISLNSLSQSKLYSELEFMICSSANNFLFRQYKVGRVSGDSIKRITNFWGSKNRPQVVQFQFDQDTQRRLIKANLRTLNFHGESAGNPVLLQANLRNWKAIVKEMSVRTFCLPDSVIRKHMHDIHKLLEMLGAPFPVSLAFQELQMRTLSLMQEELKKTHHRQSIASVRSTARPTGDASFMP